jgi:hypothetical protein
MPHLKRTTPKTPTPLQSQKDLSFSSHSPSNSHTPRSSFKLSDSTPHSPLKTPSKSGNIHPSTLSSLSSSPQMRGSRIVEAESPTHLPSTSDSTPSHSRTTPIKASPYQTSAMHIKATPEKSDFVQAVKLSQLSDPRKQLGAQSMSESWVIQIKLTSNLLS